MNSLLAQERTALLWAIAAVLVTSGLNLSAPAVMAHAIDGPLSDGNFTGILRYGSGLLAMYLVALITQYSQTLAMGSVGVRILYRLRKQVFEKLQELPLAFFGRHKAGDLISRINNDTDKVHGFFSQSLMQFVGGFVTMTGSVFFLVGLNWRLGLASLLPALGMLTVTRFVNPSIKRWNALSLESIGGVSADVAESLANFKVLVAFDRRDYFRERFQKINEENFRHALRASVANGALSPIYNLCSQGGQLIVLFYGISMVLSGKLTVGFLISYFVYLNRFYDPMRQLAALWANFQGANAAYDRILQILREPAIPAPTLPTVPLGKPSRLELRGVSFGYDPERLVLKNVSLTLEPGRRYALVGPTGGGKSTTAALMAHLYDPLEGTVTFEGRDLKSMSAEERSAKIGFILQEPFLFGETVGDNLTTLFPMEALFSSGLTTPVAGLSLGQRQVVAFLRAVQRAPDLLILDEATANIDTVTEKALERLLQDLPNGTTLVTIAHRLNTIEHADDIFFVNAGRIEQAGSMDQAVALLREEARQS